MRRILLAMLVMPLLALAEGAGSTEARGEPLVSEEAVSSQESEEAVVALPYCWDIDRKACPRNGLTQRCTDGIWSDYVCKCLYGTTSTPSIWDCPEVR
ncbi:hypothetical protein ACN47A_19085 [Myxococcus fulvus]|uniref:hypothetical protein n=1 Tax=Myxococcus fulvus TaxID=33 RepID=UPI003B9BB983